MLLQQVLTYRSNKTVSLINLTETCRWKSIFTQTRDTDKARILFLHFAARSAEGSLPLQGATQPPFWSVSQKSGYWLTAPLALGVTLVLQVLLMRDSESLSLGPLLSVANATVISPSTRAITSKLETGFPAKFILLSSTVTEPLKRAGA